MALVRPGKVLRIEPPHLQPIPRQYSDKVMDYGLRYGCALVYFQKHAVKVHGAEPHISSGLYIGIATNSPTPTNPVRSLVRSFVRPRTSCNLNCYEIKKLIF